MHNYTQALEDIRRARAEAALELHLSGLSLSQVADRLGLNSRQHAFHLIKQARAAQRARKAT
jgi:AraC-like DNA-binding protein